MIGTNLKREIDQIAKDKGIDSNEITGALEEAMREIRARLEAGGVPCWMDNTAPRGMRQPKLIDSMASAVQDAAAVVCLLSPAFQSSENCKSELMYAREIGKPIFPVMLEGVGSSRACCHGPHCTAILHCHPSLILR